MNSNYIVKWLRSPAAHLIAVKAGCPSTKVEAVCNELSLTIEKAEMSLVEIPTIEKVLKDLEASAKRQIVEAKKPQWKRQPNMQSMFKGDAGNIRTVAQLLKAGEVKLAVNHAWKMDTAARDEIPSSFWQFVKQPHRT